MGNVKVFNKIQNIIKIIILSCYDHVNKKQIKFKI